MIWDARKQKRTHVVETGDISLMHNVIRFTSTDSSNELLNQIHNEMISIFPSEKDYPRSKKYPNRRTYHIPIYEDDDDYGICPYIKQIKTILNMVENSNNIKVCIDLAVMKPDMENRNWFSVFLGRNIIQILHEYEIDFVVTIYPSGLCSGL